MRRRAGCVRLGDLQSNDTPTFLFDVGEELCRKCTTVIVLRPVHLNDAYFENIVYIAGDQLVVSAERKFSLTAKPLSSSRWLAWPSSFETNWPELNHREGEIGLFFLNELGANDLVDHHEQNIRYPLQ